MHPSIGALPWCDVYFDKLSSVCLAATFYCDAQVSGLGSMSSLFKDRAHSLLLSLTARDVIGQCEMVAPPPMYAILVSRERRDLPLFVHFVRRCTQAFFWNYGLLPPQYVSFSDSHPYPKKLFFWHCSAALRLVACIAVSSEVSAVIQH